MSENVDGSTSHDAPGRRGRHKSFDAARARARFLGVVAILVRWAGTLAAAMLAIHVVLTVGNANPANSITRFFTQWAQPLALGFNDLFRPEDPKLEVLVNYGIAALFWLVITSIVLRILSALS